MPTGPLKLTRGAAACVAIVVGLAACASTPIPNEKIAVAKASVANAEQSGAPEFARDKLARAEKAVADHDAQPATQLAEQADIDARLAAATAQEQRSHKAATEFDTNMQALRSESMRNTTPTQ